MSAQPQQILMSDAELEQHIVDCSKHFLKAHAIGDGEGMRHWLDTEIAAVRRRSPAQVARMEEDYFSTEGEHARRAAAARALS